MCMKKQTLVRDATVMLLALFAAYAMVMLTQAVMGRIEGVAMLIFMLAVFVTSMYTEGYAWGVAASLISVLAVNFAFLSPYFGHSLEKLPAHSPWFQGTLSGATVGALSEKVTDF